METMSQFRSAPTRDLLVAPAGLTDCDQSAFLSSLGFIPGIGGAETRRGIHSRGGIVVQTPDGVDLNTLWNEFQASLNIWNEKRSQLVSFLSYQVYTPYEELYQAGSTAQFEDASEYGEPVGYRPAPPTATIMGYTFKWKDLAFRYTWNYLAEVSSGQLAADNAMALEADNREVYTQVMEALFSNTRRVNKTGQTVYPLYNGQNVDALDTPPTVGAQSFAGGHNHYLTTGSVNIDPDDVEALQDTITEHGYKRSNGNTLILMVTKAVADRMLNWRSTANGGQGRYDFIPSTSVPALLLPADPRVIDGSTGARPAGTYQGFEVAGTYGEFLVIQEDWIPTGYVVAFATGGQDALPNPVAVREHTNAGLRGLRLVKGRDNDYPLVDSFYNHGMGTGIRYRGAAAIMQITTGPYTVPNFRTGPLFAA